MDLPPKLAPDGSIPNLFCVDQTLNIWRGGQPSDGRAASDLNVRSVIKLNLESEGSDDGAESVGLHVYRFPISLFWQILFRPSLSKLHAIVDRMRLGACFVHCEHGQDRTGLAVGCFRLSQGWSKVDAYLEMIGHGFHYELQGLQGRWDSLQPSDWIQTT